MITYTYKSKPNAHTHRNLAEFLTQQRLLYNGALRERIDCYQNTGVWRGISVPSDNAALTLTPTSMSMARIPDRYPHSLSNLRKKFDRFDELELIDNRSADELHPPVAVLQCVVIKGEIDEQIDREEMSQWCRSLVDRIDHTRAMRKIREKRFEMKEKRHRKSESDDSS